MPETNIHPIGRTGRAGIRGTSVSFCNLEENGYLRDIEKLQDKAIEVVERHFHSE